MAEIKIVKKKSSSGWVWLIVLVLLALAAWAVYEFAYKGNTTETIQETPGTGLIMTDRYYQEVA